MLATATPIHPDREIVSVVQIKAVLAGEASYDQLPVTAQAVVRAAWQERLDTALGEVDFLAAFAVEAHHYAELDEQGQLRIVNSGAR